VPDDAMIWYDNRTLRICRRRNDWFFHSFSRRPWTLFMYSMNKLWHSYCADRLLLREIWLYTFLANWSVLLTLCVLCVSLECSMRCGFEATEWLFNKCRDTKYRYLWHFVFQKRIAEISGWNPSIHGSPALWQINKMPHLI
jgi:hypothetical protein